MMSRHTGTRLVGLALMGGLMLSMAACGGPSDSSPSTTLGNVTAATAVYPPIPGPAPGTPKGCLGRKSTGLTTGQATQITNYLKSMPGTDQLSMAGTCPGGPVVIGLNPGAEPVAHHLWLRYGRDVAITIGLTTYNGSPGRSPRCGSLEPSMPLPEGLHLSLRLNSLRVHPGSMLAGSVVVNDSGPNGFFMDTGQPLQAVVVRPNTLQVVGVFSGGIGGTGYGPRLAPGGSGTIPVIGGTARCDGGVGSALPPGRYQAIVRVAPETSPQTPSYLTPPVAVQVTRS
jgi:hypothetical protein